MGCQVCPLFRRVSAERDSSFESCHGIQRHLTCSEASFVPLPVLKRSVLGLMGCYESAHKNGYCSLSVVPRSVVRGGGSLRSR